MTLHEETGEKGEGERGKEVSKRMSARVGVSRRPYLH